MPQQLPFNICNCFIESLKGITPMHMGLLGVFYGPVPRDVLPMPLCFLELTLPMRKHLGQSRLEDWLPAWANKKQFGGSGHVLASMVWTLYHSGICITCSDLHVKHYNILSGDLVGGGSMLGPHGMPSFLHMPQSQFQFEIIGCYGYPNICLVPCLQLERCSACDSWSFFKRSVQHGLTLLQLIRRIHLEETVLII